MIIQTKNHSIDAELFVDNILRFSEKEGNILFSLTKWVYQQDEAALHMSK